MASAPKPKAPRKPREYTQAEKDRAMRGELLLSHMPFETETAEAYIQRIDAYLVYWRSGIQKGKPKLTVVGEAG